MELPNELSTSEKAEKIPTVSIIISASTKVTLRLHKTDVVRYEQTSAIRSVQTHKVKSASL